MGRVAKYKKIKSCDPYSKQNRKGGLALENVGIWGLGDDGRRKKKRSKTAEKLKAQQHRSKKQKKNHQDDGFFDVPCAKDEFDLNDLMGSVKKQALPTMQEPDKINTVTISKHEAAVERTKLSTGNVASIPKTMIDENKVAKLLKLDKQLDPNKDEAKQQAMQRQEGESKNAYRKRTKAETRQIIQKTSVSKRKTAKLEKKKEFLKAKKLKKKGKGKAAMMYDEDDDGYDSDLPPQVATDSSGGFVTGERAIAAMAAARDEPQFGEQAERPPIFRQLPRGAQKNKQNKKTNKSTSMSTEQVEAEQNAMELMRRKVQAQYAAIKAKRRQDGDGFHL